MGLKSGLIDNFRKLFKTSVNYQTVKSNLFNYIFYTYVKKWIYAFASTVFFARQVYAEGKKVMMKILDV